MKDTLHAQAEALKPVLCEISKFMYDNPELGNEEYKAAAKLKEFLAGHGFTISNPIPQAATAFEAVYDSGKPGAAIAYLCEYDALPGIGHGCGHNMIGAMSAGAGVMLSKIINETGGRVHVFGTPAEETDGGKVLMADAGVFDNITAAMIVHPSGYTYESGRTLAMEALEFEYKGRTAHASGCPEEGINALNAVLALFNGIDALRQHVKSDVRMHGVITDGGLKANIVPDRAVAQFYLRASTKEYLAVVKAQVLKIAEGAALMTGATLAVSNYEFSNDDLKTNQPLAQAFYANLRALGITDIRQNLSRGSSDIGNVSNVCPTIHPVIGITDAQLTGHTVEMADATQTPLAQERLMIGALALAYTGYDVLVGNVKNLLDK
jgi:amidohydrolase